jgi:hypothetical protein
VPGYGPPGAQPPTRPTLYTPGQVALASFLGSPIAGALLIAGNFRRLGRPDRSWLAVLLGLLATVAILALAFVLPEKFPNSVLPAAYTGALWALTGQLFRPYPPNATGPSWGRVVAIGVGSLVGVGALLVGGLLVVMVVGPTSVSDRVFDQVTLAQGKVVTFEDGATRQDARELALALERAGYFEEGKDLEVKLLGPKGKWKVKFLVATHAHHDTGTHAYYEALGRKLRDAGFGALEILLCDQSWNPGGRVVIPAGVSVPPSTPPGTVL